MNRSLDQSGAFQGLKGLSVDGWAARCVHEDTIHYVQLQETLRWVPNAPVRAQLEYRRFSNRRRHIKAALNDMGEAFR